MLLKNIISIFFICIFSIQLFPIEKIGKMLMEQTLTEEHNETNNNSVIKVFNEDKLNHSIVIIYPKAEALLPKLSTKFPVKDEALILCHHLGVILQPPNY